MSSQSLVRFFGFVGMHHDLCVLTNGLRSHGRSFEEADVIRILQLEHDEKSGGFIIESAQSSQSLLPLLGNIQEQPTGMFVIPLLSQPV